MQAETETTPKRRIKSPKDLYGGIALIALAAVAWCASLTLTGSQGVHFGSGTAPRLFAGLLFLAGAAISIVGLLKDGEPLGRYAIRSLLLMGAAVVFFAAAISSFGLPVTAFFTILIASAVTDETRWGEALIWSAVLSTACTLLFISALGLPLPLWPKF